MSTPLDSNTRTLTGRGEPRQPSAAAKELIFAYRGKQHVMRLIGLIFLAVGSIVAAIFVPSLVQDVALAVVGEPAQGTVTSAEVNHSVEVNGVNPTTIAFTYQVDGREHRGETDTLDDARVLAAQPGAGVPLEVWRAHPGVARLQGEQLSLLGYWTVLFLLLPTLGLAVLVAAVRSNRREIRAYRFGDPVTAQVVSFAADHSTKINGKHPWLLKWSFTLDGAAYTGSLSTLRPHELAPFAEAKEVTVLVLPGDPKVNTLFVP